MPLAASPRQAATMTQEMVENRRRTPSCQCAAVSYAETRRRQVGSSLLLAAAVATSFLFNDVARGYPRVVAAIWQVSNSQMTALCGTSTQRASATFKPVADQSDGPFDDGHANDPCHQQAKIFWLSWMNSGGG